jgi:hypothetical protein
VAKKGVSEKEGTEMGIDASSKKQKGKEDGKKDSKKDSKGGKRKARQQGSSPRLRVWLERRLLGGAQGV